jgi:hypothetical protein
MQKNNLKVQELAINNPLSKDIVEVSQKLNNVNIIFKG